jgi:hypothetical protein
MKMSEELKARDNLIQRMGDAICDYLELLMEESNSLDQLKKAEDLSKCLNEAADSKREWINDKTWAGD